MFETLGKLKALLNDQNIIYLDEILGGILDPNNKQVYNPLWNWFMSLHPDSPEVFKYSWGALHNLHQIVKNYRAKKGI